MSPRFRSSASATFCGLLGFALAWMLKPSAPAPLATKGTVATASPSPPAAQVRGQNAAPRTEAALDEVSAEIRRVGALSVEDFGAELAKVFALPNSRTKAVRKAAMASLMDGPRTAAFYAAVAATKTIPNNQGEELRTLLTAGGEQDGARAIEGLLKLKPEGFPELASFVHGWAMAQPEQAVEWFNTLDEASPVRELALDGLAWGVATADVRRAGRLVESLDPRDQGTAARSVVNAAVWNHKFDDLAAWLDSAPPDLAGKALQAIDPAGYVSPEAFLPWMAGQLNRTTGPVTLQRHFSRWLSTDSAAAYTWTEEQPADVVRALTTAAEGRPPAPWMTAVLDRYQQKHGEEGR